MILNYYVYIFLILCLFVILQAKGGLQPFLLRMKAFHTSLDIKFQKLDILSFILELLLLVVKMLVIANFLIYNTYSINLVQRWIL